MAIRNQRIQRLQALVAKGMTKGLDLATGKDVESIEAFVATQKRLHPECVSDPHLLVDRLIAKREWYGGAVGFVWGLGGLASIVPSVAHSWRVHGRLVLTVAHSYGYDLDDPERREEIALCVALSSAKESVNTALKELGMLGARKALLTESSRAVIKKLPNKLVTIAGQKSLVNVGKMVPIAGGVVGGVVDFYSTRAVGKAAKTFYS